MKTKLIILLSCCLVAFTQAQVEKIEPPFWWSGMHTQKLQLMCYGKDISKYNVQIEGIKVDEVKKT